MDSVFWIFCVISAEFPFACAEAVNSRQNEILFKWLQRKTLFVIKHRAGNECAHENLGKKFSEDEGQNLSSGFQFILYYHAA